MSNKHKINAYDRAFLKTLNYGELIPMAVIKNYGDAEKAIFEEEIRSILGNLPKSKVDFGSIQFGEDEFYLAGSEMDESLLNVIGQGYNLNSALATKKRGLSCELFNVERDVIEAGVAPILSFELKSKNKESDTSDFQHKFAESLMDGGDYELFVTKSGNKHIVNIRQKSAGDLMNFADAGRYFVHNILDRYEGEIKNLSLVEIDGCEFSELETSDFLARKKLQNGYKIKLSEDRWGQHTITKADLREIMAFDYGDGLVAVGVLKNPYISINNLRRICQETRCLDDSNCKVVCHLGAEGDKFVVIAVRKNWAVDYVRYSPQIESKLRNSTRHFRTVALNNIDCHGKIVSPSRVIVGRFRADNKRRYMALQERLLENEELAVLEPSIEQYDGDIYGVYVNSKRACRDAERKVDWVRNAIFWSCATYEYTDEYGEHESSLHSGDREVKFYSDDMESIKMSQNKE